MATKYFNSTASGHGATGDWTDALNWWTSSAFTTHAGSIPANGDTVYIEDEVSTGPASPVTLATLLISQTTNYGNLGGSDTFITVVGDITVGSASYSGSICREITCSTAMFFKNSRLYITLTSGIVHGDAIFYENSQNQSTVDGDATFYDTSINGDGWADGTVTGDAQFFGYSYNLNWVASNASFYDDSINGGWVDITATFNNNSYNESSLFGTVVTFNDHSFNTYLGFLDFATFNDFSFNDPDGLVDGYACFNGSNENMGTVTGDAYFATPSATNSGTVTGTIYAFSVPIRIGSEWYVSVPTSDLKIPLPGVGSDILGTGLL